MRAVLDANVLISALLAPSGSPARVLRAWVDGDFELVISPALIAELERALAYPKLRSRIPLEDGQELIEVLRRSASVVPDPAAGSAAHRSRDPGDDYLIALAMAERAALVSGDGDLLDIEAELPIHSPADFLRLIERS